jgi:hypothetical protein
MKKSPPKTLIFEFISLNVIYYCPPPLPIQWKARYLRPLVSAEMYLVGVFLEKIVKNFEKKIGGKSGLESLP